MCNELAETSFTHGKTTTTKMLQWWQADGASPDLADSGIKLVPGAGTKPLHKVKAATPYI